MPTCPDCEFEAKSKGGLAGHRRAKHPADTPISSVLDAVAQDLHSADGPVSLRVLALKLAHTVDETTSARELPALVKELRSTLADLKLEDEEQQADGVDEVARRRAARQAAAGTARPTGSE